MNRMLGERIGLAARIGPVAMLAAALVAAAASDSLSARAPDAVAPLPRLLSKTGLFVAGSTSDIKPENLAFTPQYPLWSDGASKRRWVYLPPGKPIDASNPNAWEFPRGTKFWKEFSFGRRVETRLIERTADGSWRFATYIWNAEGTDAELAPALGVRALSVSTAPQERYRIPAQADCRACHEGAGAPVLGFGTLQLSPDRDPNAPHAEPKHEHDVDLPALVSRGAVRNLPASLVAHPPRIVAGSDTERAVLGYLHGNCGNCHNKVDTGAGVPVELDFAHDVTDSAGHAQRTVRTLLDHSSRFKMHGSDVNRVVVAGAADRSVLWQRMRSRNPNTQMPPIGTDIPDSEGLALVERWINVNLNEGVKK